MNPMLSVINQMRMAKGNPRAFVQQALNNSALAQNPIGKNIIDMAQKGDLSGVEQLGRNIARERGLDFDGEYAKFKSQLGIK